MPILPSCPFGNYKQVNAEIWNGSEDWARNDRYAGRVNEDESGCIGL